MLEDVEKYDGKVFCVSGGQPVPITGIDFVERTLQDGSKKFMLQLSGIATDVLVDSNNAANGTDSLGYNVAVVMERSIDDADNEIWLKHLNQSLGLEGKDALVDGPDWVERFVEGAEGSVVQKLRDKGLYVKSKKKADYEKSMAYGNSPYFFNPHVMPTRLVATADNYAIIKQKLEQIRKAKEMAEKEKAAQEKAMFG